LADELPEGPGAYRFFGADDALLYVGKGNSLRSNICRHFRVDKTGPKDRRLAEQVRRIDWVETAGELGAMLREAAWIKTHKPALNPRTKSKAQSYTLRAGTSSASNGETRAVEAVAMDDVELAELTQCFGLFHSEKDARRALGDIARAHTLCLKILGLEDGEGSCLLHQIGKCKGACIGKEPLILHSMRVQLALSSLKLKAWPFPGRIAVRERDSRHGMPVSMRATELHVIEHWSYLGTARTEGELAALCDGNSTVAFDVDVYRILVRYLAKKPNVEWLDLRFKTACT
jgi:DNA polymerase-3 subunit epsilon